MFFAACFWNKGRYAQLNHITHNIGFIMRGEYNNFLEFNFKNNFKFYIGRWLLVLVVTALPVAEQGDVCINLQVSSIPAASTKRPAASSQQALEQQRSSCDTQIRVDLEDAGCSRPGRWQLQQLHTSIGREGPGGRDREGRPIRDGSGAANAG